MHKNRPAGMNEICLPAGSLVRYLLDNSDYKGGKKCATDPNWSTKIFTIESLTIINGQPIMYRLSNIPNKKIFIRKELLLVPPDSMLPPAYILHNKSLLIFKFRYSIITMSIHCNVIRSNPFF